MASERYSFAAVSEKAPLLGEKKAGIYQKIEVKPMRYADIPRSVDNVQKIMHDEAMMEYLISADTAPFFETRWKLKNSINFADGISQRRMLTVNRGDSQLKYGLPGNTKTGRIYAWLAYFVRLSDPPEVKKRWKECFEKIEALTQSAFGDKVEVMYELQSLATAPEAQGKGFASALVTTVTDMGDADGHDVWVLTTSAYKFYETLGFSIVGEETIGASNPKWDREPVTLRVMLRPANAGRQSV
ncbi:hypothetical protein VTO73DRAFT_3436 [Trametes versicolor]